ncbi:hypothetical protein SDC9_201880 [bioreactor metagenome]|uniref:Uncharacterized protein n=1 Tax=bioreactor metagenome TaxID=1076179 RepID=A0A645ITI8_9ZZZZ
MDQAGAVCCVLAVITGIVMTSSHIYGPLVYVGEQLCGGAGQRRCNLWRIVIVDDLGILRDCSPGECELLGV